MKTSLRLEALLTMIPPTPYLADIGADHGYLTIEVLRRKIAKRVYACENKKGPFHRLELAIQASEVRELVDLRLSDGISELPSACKSVVIAGMGGDRIVDILGRNLQVLEGVETIIVDPHSEIPLVRREVCRLGFLIEQEQIVYEGGIYYELILFKRGQAQYEELDYLYGPYLRKEKSRLFMAKWRKRQKVIVGLLTDTKISAERRTTLQAEWERIDQL